MCKMCLPRSAEASVQSDQDLFIGIFGETIIYIIDDLENITLATLHLMHLNLQQGHFFLVFDQF